MYEIINYEVLNVVAVIAIAGMVIVWLVVSINDRKKGGK